ncbi:MAG: segregation and condensation protein [Verrucomicrobiota bacterium]|jgi:segregation and condensation protein B
MDLKFILESVLFSAEKPLTSKELRDLLRAAAEQDESGAARSFKKTPLDNIEAALAELSSDHESAGRSYRLVCVAGSWQFASQPEFAPWIKALVGHRNRPSRLSAPALETLAIIAYRQPVTRAEIEQVRGVAVDGVMQTLMERGLVEQAGRAEVIGRPITYGVTSLFLEYFGLKNLEDLPAADELRRIPVTKPESLLTVDPGLATSPPEQLTLSDVSSGASAGNGPSGAATESAANASTVATAEAPIPSRRRAELETRVELAQGAVQVSPVASELPATAGTASNAATAEMPGTEATETTSAEASRGVRGARRKKDPS